VVGVPALSWLGRMAQRRWRPEKQALVHDYHCGLRGVEKEAFLRLNARCAGMEFASEMILLATAAGYTIRQVPTCLRPDLRGGRPPHLRAIRDGLRHVKTIFRLWIS